MNNIKATIKDWDGVNFGAAGVRLVGIVEESDSIPEGESIITTAVVGKDKDNNVVTKAGSYYTLSNIHPSIDDPDTYKQQFLNTLPLVE